jgi:hypothetical protein
MEALTNPNSLIFVALMNWVTNRLQESEYECELCLEDFILWMRKQEKERKQTEYNETIESAKIARVSANIHNQLFPPEAHQKAIERKSLGIDINLYQEKILKLSEDMSKQEQKRHKIEKNIDRLKQQIGTIEKRSQDRQENAANQILEALQKKEIKIYDANRNVIAQDKAEELIKLAPRSASIRYDLLKKIQGLASGQLIKSIETCARSKGMMMELTMAFSIARDSSDDDSSFVKDLFGVIKSNKELGKLVQRICDKNMEAEMKDIEGLIKHTQSLETIYHKQKVMADKIKEIVSALTHYQEEMTKIKDKPNLTH